MVCIVIRNVVRARKEDKSRQEALAQNTEEEENRQNTVHTEEEENRQNTVHTEDVRTFALESLSRRRGNVGQATTERPQTSTEFKYPSAWKGRLPQFPYVPSEEEELEEDKEVEEEKEVTPTPLEKKEKGETPSNVWHNGEMPVFPFGSGKNPPKK